MEVSVLQADMLIGGATYMLAEDLSAKQGLQNSPTLKETKDITESKLLSNNS